MPRPSRSARWVAVFLVLGVGVAVPREAAAQEKAPAKPEPAIKRRTPTSEEDLRKQLQSLPEAGFDQPAANELYVSLIKSMKATPPVKNLPQDLGATTLHEKAAGDNRPEAV